MSKYTLAFPVQTEIEIRKSRFIGFVFPVSDRDAAMQEIDRLRNEHRAAAHVCWALMAGGQSGMSDDGEPSGTAGRPMLEVLRHHELDGVLAAVVRYFGGIKLGAGGLVRAYTDAVAAALMQAQRIERISYAELDVECDYAEEARVRRWAEQQGYALVHGSHAETVRLRIRLPGIMQDQAKDALRNLTQGRARFS
ncbi:IMPACT family protein [Noviherbaspirillum massiliense]|uniref:IMPACT family protein n=1 Tax=Noviherbaspirillum massiliense TaxID=1465823 RepID=UPI0002FA078E|nr:YigZ family protein [Noviherbaspirillum massiliense]